MATRTYEVRYKTWNVAMSVVDPTTPDQPLYTLTSNGALGNSTEIRDSTGSIVAQGYASSWKTGVKMTMLSSDKTTSTFETKTTKSMGMGSPQYHSPAFGGQQMTLKNKAMSTKYNYTMIDEQSNAVAKFESAGMKWKTVGKLEVMSDMVTSQQQMDEIVATMLTLTYRKMVQANTAAVV